MTDVPVHRLKWTWMPEARDVHGLTVGVVSSDEPPSPEYIVVITGDVYGIEQVARCDRFQPGALAKMQERADFVFDLLEVAELLWSDAGLLKDVPERPG